LFYIVSFLTFLADLIFKKLAAVKLPAGTTFPVIKGLLHLTLVRNYGVAFGLFPYQRPYLILVGIIICAVIIYMYVQTPASEFLLRLSFALILGGSLGNLFDRIFHGYVIDYLDFRVFPVFNLADTAINVGIALILLDLILKRKCTRY
jgi:signal peptidase II